MSSRFVSLLMLSALLAIGCARPSSSVAPTMEPLDRVPQQRLERLTRGINLSHWMAQWRVTPEHIRTYFTREDAWLARSMGFRHARLTLNPEPLLNEEHPEKPDPERLALLKDGITMLRAAGLAVIVDLHPETAFKRRLAEEPGFDDTLAAFWGGLAGALRHTDPDWVFLETMNEPEIEDAKSWQAIQEKLLTAMRAGAPRHTLIATGHAWSNLDRLREVRPVADRNVVYNFHFYEPIQFSHQGATWGMAQWRHTHDVPYPSDAEAIAAILPGIENAEARRYLEQFGEERWNRRRVRARIAHALRWARMHDVSLTCNEFGAHRPATPREDRLRWLRDVRGELEAAGIGWCVWDYARSFAVAPGQPGEREPDEGVLEALGL
jgi:hypothetical protein